jgi:hypothetical protein
MASRLALRAASPRRDSGWTTEGDSGAAAATSGDVAAVDADSAICAPAVGLGG